MEKPKHRLDDFFFNLIMYVIIMILVAGIVIVMVRLTQ